MLRENAYFFSVYMKNPIYQLMEHNRTVCNEVFTAWKLCWFQKYTPMLLTSFFHISNFQFISSHKFSNKVLSSILNHNHIPIQLITLSSIQVGIYHSMTGNSQSPYHILQFMYEEAEWLSRFRYAKFLGIFTWSFTQDHCW